MKLFKIGWFNFKFKPNNNPSDRVRFAQIRAAKDTKIVPWVKATQKYLQDIGFQPMEVDVVFDGTIDYYSHGIAYHEHDTDKKYIHLNNTLLSTGKDHGDAVAINTLIHEWAHIWLYHRVNDKVLFGKLQDKLFELRKTDYASDGALEYALEYDRGDELFTYLVTFYDTLEDDLREFLQSILK